MSMSGLFSQLNDSILRDPLNKQYDFGVEGEPHSAMDNVDPRMKNVANGLLGGLGAMGAGGPQGPQPLRTSQEKVAKRKADHRDVLAKQAASLGLHDLAKGIATGDIDNKDAMAAMQAHKDAEAKKAAATLDHERSVETAKTVRQQEVDDREEDRRWKVEDAKTEQDLLKERRDYVEVGGRVFLVDGNGKKLQDLGPTEAAKLAADKAKEEQTLSTLGYQDSYDQSNQALHSLEQMEAVVAEHGMNFTTAHWGAIFTDSDAGDVVTAVDDIKAKMGASALALAKSVGNGSSGYGALSESEMRILQDSIAALKVGMSDKAFARATADIRDKFELAKKRLVDRNKVNGTGGALEEIYHAEVEDEGEDHEKYDYMTLPNGKRVRRKKGA